MEYQLLKWDSNFFGGKVAKISPAEIESGRLREILSELAALDTMIVYWAANEECESSIIEDYGGKLVDRKITFSVNLSLQNQNDWISTKMIEPFSESINKTDLEELAIQSGEYSRFAVDPNIARNKFTTLYKMWIHNALKSDSAQETLLARDSGKTAGMLVTSEKNGQGNIELLAVDKQFRGRQHGERLVRAAQMQFIDHGYKTGTVVTQEENNAACKLYRKCNFTFLDVKYFYHFWL
jgi:dTDP-4-amino-4,6-dideoxy-D-galactose acyltransferase